MSDSNLKHLPSNPKLAFALLQEVVETDLLSELIRQLNKDLSLSGKPHQFSESASPGQLVEELNAVLEKYVNGDFQAFLNFLYRVDIPESKAITSESVNLKEYLSKCSYEILRREWQKVWLRNKTR